MRFGESIASAGNQHGSKGMHPLDERWPLALLKRHFQRRQNVVLLEVQRLIAVFIGVEVPADIRNEPLLGCRRGLLRARIVGNGLVQGVAR